MWSVSSQRSLEQKERRMRKPESPAVKIIRMFYAEEGYQQGRSNIRTEHARRAILHACIRYGVRFDIDDFEVIHGAGEWEYAMACGSERGILNMSAAHAYEKKTGRKPFLIEDPGNATATRVYCGRQFDWNRQSVTCTSFSEDQLSFTACSYKPQVDGTYERKVDRRYRITHQMILDARKAAKAKAAPTGSPRMIPLNQPGPCGMG